MSVDLATHIRELRQALGWTQDELAKRARIDQADLSRIERDNIDPRWSTVNKVVNALGETFELAAAPTTVRPALTAETRENSRRTALSAAPRRRTPKAVPIKR
ncbi:MAG: helix-turn-helix domain-containing protein [Acidimicrobiia bacterium]